MRSRSRGGNVGRRGKGLAPRRSVRHNECQLKIRYDEYEPPSSYIYNQILSPRSSTVRTIHLNGSRAINAKNTRPRLSGRRAMSTNLAPTNGKPHCSSKTAFGATVSDLIKPSSPVLPEAPPGVRAFALISRRHLLPLVRLPRLQSVPCSRLACLLRGMSKDACVWR